MRFKKYILLLSIVVFAVVSCKDKNRFVEPTFILGQWVKATNALNYATYRRYEAYPKNEQVFREIYRDFYFDDLLVTVVGKADEDQVLKDGEGNPFISKNIRFEVTQVNRHTRKPGTRINGDVDFIRFIRGPRSKDGWLMWNRSLIRVE